MKQKYSITLDNEVQKVTINEYAELDKEIMSLLCTQTYEIQNIKEAMTKSREALVQVVRTVNFYPPFIYAYSIADTIIGMVSKNNNTSAELIFDDNDFLTKDQAGIEEIDPIEEEPESIEELLEDDIEDNFEDEESLGSINSPLKIADDESLDIEDDI